jgi:hypothetical protein
MQQVWAQTVDRAKQEIIAPTLWRALERTVPVAWEDNTFVVGLATAEGQMASQMNTGERLSAIERILRSLVGNNALQFRVIEGTSHSDWEYAKARDAAAVAQRQQTTQRRQQEAGAFASWDEIHDRVSRLWANSDYRSLASGKARYMDQALTLVEQAMDTLCPADGKTNEQTERGISRVIERIASTTGSDAALIALLLFERRRKGGSQ